MGPIVVALLAACGGKAAVDSAEPTTPPKPFETTTASCAIEDGNWSVLADGFGDGVLLSAWSNGPTEVLMVGGDLAGGPGLLVHYDGATLCTETAVTERALWWIHGSTPGEWYAVGEAGTILHHIDGVRTREDVPTAVTLYGVYDDGEAVWAVGGDPFTDDSGEVWRKQDGTWERVAEALPGVVFKVWNGLFVGDGVAYSWDGAQLVDVSTGEKMLTVRGRSATEAWAVGGKTSAIVNHWDGTSWLPFDSTGLYGPLNGVWTAESEDLWVASFNGTMARHTDAGWEMPLPPLTTNDFHAAWGHCSEVLFVGGNMISGPPYRATIGRYGPRQGAVQIQECIE